MWMECFAGDMRIEGDDAETIADRFVAHASKSHDWLYPEEAIRHYARKLRRGNCEAYRYRRHGISAMLLDRVIADAPDRGAEWIEGYPRNAPEGSDAGHFRGTRDLYDGRGFQPVEQREHDTVMRRPVIVS